jgi:hypothetical protein
MDFALTSSGIAPPPVVAVRSSSVRWNAVRACYASQRLGRNRGVASEHDSRRVDAERRGVRGHVLQGGVGLPYRGRVPVPGRGCSRGSHCVARIGEQDGVGTHGRRRVRDESAAMHPQDDRSRRRGRGVGRVDVQIRERRPADRDGKAPFRHGSGDAPELGGSAGFGTSPERDASGRHRASTRRRARRVPPQHGRRPCWRVRRCPSPLPETP